MYDQRWVDIPPDEVKTTHPRTLVHGMNTYINKWKWEYKAVQEVINALPEILDISESVEPTIKNEGSRTLTSQED